MKTKLIALSIMLLIATCINSCKKDPGTGPEGENPTGVMDIPTKEAQVVLPTGFSYDLSGSELFVIDQSFSVGKDGKTKTANIPGVATIAYLFDKNENPILAGFITDSTANISVESTANVLLYYAYGLPLQPDTLTEVFINEIQEMAGVSSWEEEFAALWKSDPMTLSNGTFAIPLKSKMAELISKSDPVDIRKINLLSAKASDIHVDANDIRSGLQIHEVGLSQLAITNNYIRRAHAFFYKTKSKDLDGVETVLIPKVNTSTIADKDLKISRVNGFGSIKGVLGAGIEGRGLEFFAKENGPVQLDLEDNESEATYSLRVIGPGVHNHAVTPLTAEEAEKLEDLEIETFIADFLFPVIVTTMNATDFKWNKDKLASGDWLKTKTLVKQMFAATPAFAANIEKGEYLNALKVMLKKIGVDGVVQSGVKRLIEMALVSFYKSFDPAKYKDFPDFNETAKKFNRPLAVMKVIDVALSSSDILRALHDVGGSFSLEQWEVKARSSKVSLSPKEAVVTSRGRQEVTATIKNLPESENTHPYFEWSTSGKYGDIRDTRGNKGAAFKSADPKVTYYSNTSASQLSEESNFEYVYVKAYMGSQVIGTDTVKLNLRKSSYEIKPKGVTLTGKKGGDSEVKLYLEHVKGPAEDDFSDMRIVWTTEGKHGKLAGTNTGYAATVTIMGENSVNYHCVDDQTKEGVEKITARIYSKSADGQYYFLYDELETTININNDERKRIIRVPISVISWGPTESGIYTNCGAGTIFYVDPVENAVSYSARVIEFSPEVIPRVTGTGKSWTAASGKLNDEGRYEFGYVLSGAVSSPTWMGPPDCGKYISAAAARTGTAQVIVTLKP